MTIRNEKAYMNNLWDWGFIENILPGSCAVSDIDGIIERRGHFLLIETKGPGVEVPQGQAIMFDSLSAIPQFSVWVVWGKPGKVEAMQRWGQAVFRADNQNLLDTVQLWWELADNTPCPPRAPYTVGG